MAAFACFRANRQRFRRPGTPCGGGSVPEPAPRPVPFAHRLRPQDLRDLVHRPVHGPDAPRPDRHRTVRVSAGGGPLLPALEGVAQVIRGGRLPSRLRCPPDPAVLAGRVTHARARTPAIRSPDYHRPPRAGHQGLRADRDARPPWPANLRVLRREHRQPWRGTRPPCTEGSRQGRQDRADPAATRGRPGDRRPRPRSDPAQRPPVCGWTGTRRPQAETTGRQGRDTDRPDAPADAPTHS
jgi:hypothetical protein